MAVTYFYVRQEGNSEGSKGDDSGKQGEISLLGGLSENMIENVANLVQEKIEKRRREKFCTSREGAFYREAEKCSQEGLWETLCPCRL